MSQNQKKILKGLGLTECDNKVSNYSGGWRMRLAIAKSLISKPSVLITVFTKIEFVPNSIYGA